MLFNANNVRQKVRRLLDDVGFPTRQTQAVDDTLLLAFFLNWSRNAEILKWFVSRKARRYKLCASTSSLCILRAIPLKVLGCDGLRPVYCVVD